MRRTSNFEKWAEGKHPFLAFIAHSQVLQSKMAYGIIKSIQENDMLFGDLPAPNLDTWLKLFRSHPSGTDYIKQTLGDPTGLMQSADFLANQLADNEPIRKTNISFSDAENIFREYLKTANIIDQELELAGNEH